MKKPLHKFWIGDQVHEVIEYRLSYRPTHTVLDFRWDRCWNSWLYLLYPNCWILEARLESKMVS